MMANLFIKSRHKTIHVFNEIGIRALSIDTISGSIVKMVWATLCDLFNEFCVVF